MSMQNMDQKNASASEKKRTWSQLFNQTEIPLAVYAAIFSTMALMWIFQRFHEDIMMGFFTELMGAAFTLFIIDTLLVRSKAKRWKIVQEHVDYLIARDVNRLRDGLSVRVLGFDPIINQGDSEVQVNAVREQRSALLAEIETKSVDEIAAALSMESLFSDSTYAYLRERSGALWDVFNMRYSEYMDPELVSTLIQLHTHLNDLGGHIRQYARAETFPDDAAYYQTIGLRGASVSIREIVRMVNELKRQGYSMTASIAND